MAPRSRTRLPDIPPGETRWMRSYRLLLRFKRLRGRWPLPTESYPDRCRLGQWMYWNRRKHFAGMLSSFRLRKLEDAGCPIDPIRYVDQFWVYQFKMLQRFRKAHPDRWPYTGEHFPEGNHLGRWLREQRIKHSRKTLKPQYRQALESIGFKVRHIVAHKDLWERQFNRLLKYRLRHPRNWPDILEGPLGLWCNTQRVNRRSGKLSRSRVRRLNVIGFTWHVNQSKWDSRFDQLKEYLALHGRPPSTWSSKGKKAEDLVLGVWLNFQRIRIRRGLLESDRLGKLSRLGLALPIQGKPAQVGKRTRKKSARRK